MQERARREAVVVELVAEDDRPGCARLRLRCVGKSSAAYLKVVWYKARHTPRLAGGAASNVQRQSIAAMTRTGGHGRAAAVVVRRCSASASWWCCKGGVAVARRAQAVWAGWLLGRGLF